MVRECCYSSEAALNVWNVWRTDIALPSAHSSELRGAAGGGEREKRPYVGLLLVPFVVGGGLPHRAAALQSSSLPLAAALRVLGLGF
jgi:hypothetical protein